MLVVMDLLLVVLVRCVGVVWGVDKLSGVFLEFDVECQCGGMFIVWYDLYVVVGAVVILFVEEIVYVQ